MLDLASIYIGTILGAVVGAIIFRWRKKRVTILQRYRGTLIGIGAGIIIWLVFFVPTTTLLIEPTLHNIASLSSESQKRISTNLDPLIRNVVISAIVFHIAWGAISRFVERKISTKYQIKVRLANRRDFQRKNCFKDIIIIIRC